MNSSEGDDDDVDDLNMLNINNIDLVLMKYKSSEIRHEKA